MIISKYHDCLLNVFRPAKVKPHVIIDDFWYAAANSPATRHLSYNSMTEDGHVHEDADRALLVQGNGTERSYSILRLIKGRQPPKQSKRIVVSGHI